MRICVHQFSIANEAYIGASVSFFTVDGAGAKTATLATLYDSTTGAGTLSNPQTLDSEGKFAQPVYIDTPVIGAVSGLGFTDHDTGIINLIVNDRGDWATAAVYAVNDLVNDAAVTGNKYICTARHTAGTFATDRDTNLYWDLFIDLERVMDWANKIDGAVDGSEHSAKAYAVGGTGVTDTPGKGAAKEWATKAEDSTVDDSGYSALHHALKAQASAAAASSYVTPSVEIFTAGAGFVAGTTTTLALAAALASENFLEVTFDGVTQHHDTYSIAGSPSTITFTSAIPLGTLAVECRYGVRAASVPSSEITWSSAITPTNITSINGVAAATAQYTTAEAAKVGHISVTQAVDLDAIETRVNALDAAVILKGSWDASVGTFPGGGTAQAGESWIVSVGGTVGGQVFVANDRIVAILDNASTTVYAANWHKLDYTDQVLSVNTKTGAVVLNPDDLSDAASTNKFASTANVTAAGALMDSELANIAAVKALNQGVATTDSPTFVTVNATTVDATNIEVTNIKAKDGTAAGSIADATGVVTLASTVLTTTDIDGGNIDGAVIGGTTPAAITGTTITASGPVSVNANKKSILDYQTSTNFGRLLVWGDTGVDSEFRLFLGAGDANLAEALGITKTSATFAGSVTAGAPIYTKSYTVATVPSAATAGGLIYVSDEAGGAIMAFSDGTNWRRVTDRAIVS